MASRIERESPFTKGGVAAVGGAVALCLLGLGQSTRNIPTPPSLLFVTWVGAAGLILVLVRVRLPNALKMGCIIATLGVMFLLAAQSDLFGIKRVSAKVDSASAGSGFLSEAGSGARRDGAAGGSGGAAVHLHPAANGDLGWSSRINSRLAAGIGGASATWLTFSGSVSAYEAEGEQAVMIAWEIRGAGAPVHCGMMSIIGHDEQAMVRQLRETLETAASHSNRKGRPACF